MFVFLLSNCRCSCCNCCLFIVARFLVECKGWKGTNDKFFSFTILKIVRIRSQQFTSFDKLLKRKREKKNMAIKIAINEYL